MKKLFLYFVAAICWTACSESKEAKAEKLAKKALNGVIVNIDTYEPIETTVDSAFAPQMTAETFNIYAQWPNQVRKLADALEEADRAKTEMSVWEKFYSAIGKEQYNQAKKKYEFANKQAEEIKEKMQTFVQKQEQYSKEKPVFSGYKVHHKCRYVNKEGRKTIGEVLFFMNKDLTAVEGMIDMDDEVVRALIESFGTQDFVE